MTRLLIRFYCFCALLLGGAGAVIASDLPPCPEYRHATKSLWINCFGTCTCASGNKYVGEFKDGKLNGYAIRYFSDGSIFKEGI